MSVLTRADTRSPTGAPRATRSALDGAIVAVVFGTVWALWAALALDGEAAAAIGGSGVMCGSVLLFVAVRCRAGTAPTGASMFVAPAYRAVVAVEVLTLVVGQVLLADLGQQKYEPVWVALVVGAHLLVFGRLFAPVFNAVGSAMIVAGLLGAGCGVTGSGAHCVQAVTGALAALVLFVAGGASAIPVAMQSHNS